MIQISQDLQRHSEQDTVYTARHDTTRRALVECIPVRPWAGQGLGLHVTRCRTWCALPLADRHGHHAEEEGDQKQYQQEHMVEDDECCWHRVCVSVRVCVKLGHPGSHLVREGHTLVQVTSLHVSLGLQK